MFATDWLSEIQATTLIISVAAILASVPFNVTKNIDGKKLKAKPLRLQRTGWVLLAIIGLGWLLAKIAAHIHSPTIDVDMTGISQLILVPALTLITVLTLVRAFGQNNLLSQLGILFIRYAPYVVIPLGKVCSVAGSIFIDALNSKTYKEATKPPNDGLTDGERAMLRNGMNYKGEYCDQGKTNWYTD